MFLARLEAASQNLPSPVHTPVINYGYNVPEINRNNGRLEYSRSIKPKRLSFDKYFYIYEIDCVIGKVENENLNKDGNIEITLNNQIKYIVKDDIIIDGKFNFNSIIENVNNMHFQLIE